MNFFLIVVTSGALALNIGPSVKPYEYRPAQYLDINGKLSYEIECYYRKNLCSYRADRLCPDGYEVIEASASRVVPTFQVKSPADPDIDASMKYDLVVECRDRGVGDEADAPAPESIDWHVVEM